MILKFSLFHIIKCISYILYKNIFSRFKAQLKVFFNKKFNDYFLLSLISCIMVKKTMLQSQYVYQSKGRSYKSFLNYHSFYLKIIIQVNYRCYSIYFDSP